jgi:hypothetical protein
MTISYIEPSNCCLCPLSHVSPKCVSNRSIANDHPDHKHFSIRLVHGFWDAYSFIPGWQLFSKAESDSSRTNLYTHNFAIDRHHHAIQSTKTFHFLLFSALNIHTSWTIIYGCELLYSPKQSKYLILKKGLRQQCFIRFVFTILLSSASLCARGGVSFQTIAKLSRRDHRLTFLFSRCP